MAIVEQTASYTMTISDSVVHVCSGSGANPTGGQTDDITITLPKASEAKGRVYRIVKANSSGYEVIIDSNGSEQIDTSNNYSLTIDSLEQFTGINFTSYLISGGNTPQTTDDVWGWKSSRASVNYKAVSTDLAATISNSGTANELWYDTTNKVFKVDADVANIIHVTSSSSNITINLPTATPAMYTNKAKLRIVHINNTGTDGVARTVTVTDNSINTFPDYSLSVGQSINLFVNSSSAWERAGPTEIVAADGTTDLGAGTNATKYTFLVKDLDAASTANQTLTLPTVTDRFDSSANPPKPPSITISSSLRTGSVTINREGTTDIIYDDVDTAAGIPVASITLSTTRPSVTLTALGNGAWKTDKTLVSHTVNTGIQKTSSGKYSKITTSTTQSTFKLPITCVTASNVLLPQFSDKNGFIVKNIGTSNITITTTTPTVSITLAPKQVISVSYENSTYIAKPAYLSIDVTNAYVVNSEATDITVQRGTLGTFTANKIFTSTGFTTNGISLAGGATKTFVYSPGIDAWAVV